MFKKLKDKLAEEVKSSPQKFQQFAQAAQAAVTSASSSISDITNSDLFSIGDNDLQTNRVAKGSPGGPRNAFQEVSLIQPSSMQTSMESADFAASQDVIESQRQRKLSNSSFASDVSFRLPSYESPSMYHLQSDIEISASEAEERGFSSGNVSLDRVTKEQIYAAYRRTQDRYTKYRTQYADLARHYKLLERDNAKARSVLVETQDKALRRISELREQCALEQSAKAHLEKALRIEIEEKNLKIDTLDTKIKLLQNSVPEAEQHTEEKTRTPNNNENNVQLISFDSGSSQPNDDISSEILNMNNKIEKLEKLVNKYKESLKTNKEKNAQLTTEIQILHNEIENKDKEIELLKIDSNQLKDAKLKIEELNEHNEELQNKVNVYEFNETKELSTLELDLQKAQEKIEKLQSKIDIFSKREEEYAISLAENKLSIHKELDSKENEIKSLKNLLAESKNEVQSLNIVLDDYKNNALSLEGECCKLKNDLAELNSAKSKSNELEAKALELTDKCQALETAKSKAFEEYKCLQLQLKQETAEKLAMIDRNNYLENRNTQLSEENTKKTSEINALHHEIQVLKKEKVASNDRESSDRTEMRDQIELWKNKCRNLELEIQEERDELVKLQAEIEKLLANDESIQIQNSELNSLVNKLNSENAMLKQKQLNFLKMKNAYDVLLRQVIDLKKIVGSVYQDTKTLKEISHSEVSNIRKSFEYLLEQQIIREESSKTNTSLLSEEYENILKEVNSLTEENFKLKSEINDNERRTNDLDQKLERVNKEFDQTQRDMKSVQESRDSLHKQLAEVQSECKILQNNIDSKNNELINLRQQVAHLTEKLNTFERGDKASQEENRRLEEQLEENKMTIMSLQDLRNQSNSEYATLKKDTQKLSETINKLNSTIECLRNEKQVLEEKLKIASARCEDLQNSSESSNNELQQNIADLTEKLNKIKSEYDMLQNVIKKRDEELALLTETSDNFERNKESHVIELADLNKSYAESIHQTKAVKQENTSLLEKVKEQEGRIDKSQQQIKDLTQENISLKTQSDEIKSNIKRLEIELSEVKKSHEDMESEKDHLNSVIEKLEVNERVRQYDTKESQTTANMTGESLETAEIVKLIGKSEAQINSLDNSETTGILTSEIEKLREENKRLQSDVTGLQTYLAQISKENSILNDKLRELIASGETTGNQSEAQSEKDKLEELIRENRELAEENLELKDQINTQHYAQQDEIRVQDKSTEVEIFQLKDNYTNLMDHNSKLGTRMHDLEQINKSLNINVSQLQGHNEKLKLTNEKLERRLDEALVSLRHLHSLQENTELEYLRNILYEYLTGTGAHSVTLAKVLAAIVKFDKAQTDFILQKEKERQGFLRQLGLL